MGTEDKPPCSENVVLQEQLNRTPVPNVAPSSAGQTVHPTDSSLIIQARFHLMDRETKDSRTYVLLGVWLLQLADEPTVN